MEVPVYHEEQQQVITTHEEEEEDFVKYRGSHFGNSTSSGGTK